MNVAQLKRVLEGHVPGLEELFPRLNERGSIEASSFCGSGGYILNPGLCFCCDRPLTLIGRPTTWPIYAKPEIARFACGSNHPES